MIIPPLEVIEEAIELIINGEIINYKYDTISEKESVNLTV